MQHKCQTFDTGSRQTQTCLKFNIYIYIYIVINIYISEGPWSYGSWIYNYQCNQYLSPLMLWVRISIRARCTTICDKVCQWLSTCLVFSGSSGFLHP